MPFIEPRLGSKTVESIWSEAGSGDLTLCPKCDDVAESVGDGKRQCISCYHTFTPKTSARKTAAGTCPHCGTGDIESGAARCPGCDYQLQWDIMNFDGDPVNAYDDGKVKTAASDVVCNQSGCHNKATKIWDTPVKGSQVGFCDEHDGPPTKAQPKTAKAKVVRGTGRGYTVKCDACGVSPMNDLTYAGATQTADTHNEIHHSKTAGFPPPSGATGFDPNGEWCSGTGETPLHSGGMNVAGGCPRCYEQNPDLSEGGTIKAHNPKKFHEAAVMGDGVDYDGVEPGSPESASYRPTTRDETLRDGPSGRRPPPARPRHPGPA